MKSVGMGSRRCANLPENLLLAICLLDESPKLPIQVGERSLRKEITVSKSSVVVPVSNRQPFSTSSFRNHSRLSSDLAPFRSRIRSCARWGSCLLFLLFYCLPAAFSAKGTGLLVVSGVSCGYGSMTGSGTDFCTVTLTGAAPVGGAVVNLSSSNAAVLVPATVTVPMNANSAKFTATASSVATAQTVKLTAAASGTYASFTLQLNANGPALSMNVASMAFGDILLSSSGTKSVTLTSTGNVPVTVNSATLTGTGFTVSGPTFPVALNPGGTVLLTVRFTPTTSGATSGNLTIASNSSAGSSAVIGLSGTGLPTLSTLSCGNASMTGSGTDSCTVTLTGAALAGGTAVNLSSSNLAVTVPTAVTVGANATSAVFTAIVTSVGTAQPVTLTATAAGVSANFALQLIAAVPTLSVDAASITFGNVTLNTPATQSVTLTSTGTASVTVNSATLTGTGFTVSGATFPVTLNPGQALTLAVVFNPIATGTATGTLTIASNSSTSSSAVIVLTGAGTAHQVELSWNPPSNSSDPVVGYNVYRAPSGTSNYQLLHSSGDVQTTYVDSPVQSGQSYDYIVMSVDSHTVLSIPSNVFRVAIP